MAWVRLYSLLFVFKQIIQFSDEKTEFAMVFFDCNLLTKHQHAFAFFGSHGGIFMQSLRHSPETFCPLLYNAMERP